MNKFISCNEAVEMIPDGASIMVGAFMGVASPHRLIAEMMRQGRKDLTVIANDTGTPGFGIGQLVAAKRIRKLIASHIGLNPETQRQVIAGEIILPTVTRIVSTIRLRRIHPQRGGFPTGRILQQI